MPQLDVLNTMELYRQTLDESSNRRARFVFFDVLK